MPRLLSIDYGKKRTGIAITDELQIIASGLGTVPTTELIAFLKNYFSKEKVEEVIIGEPIQMNGEPSQSHSLVIEFIKTFKDTFPDMKIITVDERFTSKMAFQTMIDSGLKKQQRKNKAMVDEIAATIILRDYLRKISK